MPAKTTVPTPMSASLGLVVAATDEMRRAPLRALHLPLVFVTNCVRWNERIRLQYEELAARGEKVVARLLGQASNAVGTVGESASNGLVEVRGLLRAARDTAAGTAGGLVEGFTDATDIRGNDLRGNVRSLTRDGLSAFDGIDGEREALDARLAALAEEIGDVTELGEERAADSWTEPPGSEVGPTPAKGAFGERAEEQQAHTRREVPHDGAAPEVPVPAHDDLPLSDFDHMTLDSLRGRLRRLDLRSLEQLRAYEVAHARRRPILTMLENRIAKLSEQLEHVVAPQDHLADVHAGGTSAPPLPATSGPANRLRS